MKILSPWPLLLGFLSCCLCAQADSARLYPAPNGEPLSKHYAVEVQGQPLPIYQAKVASGTPALRWKAMDDKAHSADFFDTASFGYFDMDGPVSITVTCPDDIRSAKVLPSALNLDLKIQGKRLSLTLSEPKLLTIEINGEWVKSLHLFANPPEKDAPKPTDPNVIFFGPGIHEVSHQLVTNGQTVYIAGGAIVRGVVKPENPSQVSSYSGLKNYSPVFELRGTGIQFRGRGILDGGLCPTHARNLLLVRGQDIQLEGVILRDSSTWTIPVRQSKQVSIRNVKLLGYRANSDGIDICNSQDVLVDGCFIRTLDDLVVIKSDRGQGPAGRIRVQNCVLWNEVAHALSVGAELREDVQDVLFTNCDVIHDKGREWTLRVYHCDAARISNIVFENLRIEESPRLISLWIDKAVWSRDSERGHIDGVTFKNIHALADPLRVEFKGFDETHQIENIQLENVTVNSRPLTPADIKTNAFVRQISCRP